MSQFQTDKCDNGNNTTEINMDALVKNMPKYNYTKMMSDHLIMNVIGEPFMPLSHSIDEYFNTLFEPESQAGGNDLPISMSVFDNYRIDDGTVVDNEEYIKIITDYLGSIPHDDLCKYYIMITGSLLTSISSFNSSIYQYKIISKYSKNAKTKEYNDVDIGNECTRMIVVKLQMIYCVLEQFNSFTKFMISNSSKFVDIFIGIINALCICEVEGIYNIVHKVFEQLCNVMNSTGLNLYWVNSGDTKTMQTSLENSKMILDIFITRKERMNKLVSDNPMPASILYPYLSLCTIFETPYKKSFINKDDVMELINKLLEDIKIYNCHYDADIDDY